MQLLKQYSVDQYDLKENRIRIQVRLSIQKRLSWTENLLLIVIVGEKRRNQCTTAVPIIRKVTWISRLRSP